jgi:hypothetical protein
MSLAYHDTANGTTYGTSVVTSGGIGVSIGDLLVVCIGGSDDRYAPTTISDSIGNTYNLQDVRNNANGSTFRMGWCVSASAGSVIFTGNFVDTASQRAMITVVTFTVDAGDTVSVDSNGILVSAWADQPFITSEFNVTETDCVAVASFIATGPQTYSNHEIPNGTGAQVVTSGYGSQATFYQLFTSTATGVEAAVDSAGNSGIAAECVVFKSVAAAGGGVNLSIFDRHYRGLMAA